MQEWKEIPLKNSLLKLLLTIAIFLFAFTNLFSGNLLIFLLFIFIGMYLQGKFGTHTSPIYLKSSEQELQVFNGSDYTSIEWSTVSFYNQFEGGIILYNNLGESVVINFDRLLDKIGFQNYLDQKLAHLRQIECLECGTMIGPSENRCPICGWTWEVPPPRTKNDLDC